jgi:hypothetical protein
MLSPKANSAASNATGARKISQSWSRDDITTFVTAAARPCAI